MDILFLFVGSFLAALVSGAAGFGGSLLLLPIATACVGAEMAVPVLTIAQLIGNIARMTTGWKQIDWKPVGLFSLTSLPLAALGAFGFALLPKDIVTRCIGLALILLVIFKVVSKRDLPNTKATLLVGGAVTGGLSGLCGSGGPIGAAVFLSLDLAPVAYIASEAATATAMHILKSIIYSKLTNINYRALLIGLAMGLFMVIGTYVAKHFITKIEKGKFQKYVAALFCIVGIYMAVSGA
jgi:Predicted permeases